MTTVQEVVAAREIKSILHFATNRGSLGILDARALKARDRLNKDQRLEHIFTPNAADRSRDAKWLDYVNLSVSHINESFFGASAGSWHKEKDFWWCIFDFDPIILRHEGVVFATTNNMYSGVRHAVGAAGLEALFSSSITRWSSSRSRSIINRDADSPPHFTICSQAEVLYPGEISTEFLRSIYVSQDTFADELASQIAVVRHSAVQIYIRPEMFEAIR